MPCFWLAYRVTTSLHMNTHTHTRGKPSPHCGKEPTDQQTKQANSSGLHNYTGCRPL